MNDSDGEPMIKSNNKRNKWVDKKNNFLSKEESDYKSNESVTNDERGDERGELLFFGKIAWSRNRLWRRT